MSRQITLSDFNLGCNETESLFDKNVGFFFFSPLQVDVHSSASSSVCYKQLLPYQQPQQFYKNKTAGFVMKQEKSSILNTYIYTYLKPGEIYFKAYFVFSIHQLM